MGEHTWGHAGVGAVDALADSRQRMEAVAGAIVLHPELLVSTGIIAAGQGEGRDAAVIEREAAAVARQRQQGHLPAGHRLDRELVNVPRLFQPEPAGHALLQVDDGRARGQVGDGSVILYPAHRILVTGNRRHPANVG